MQIFPLSEGAFTIDKTKRFVPFDLEKDDLQQRTTGSLLVEIQPFAVITSEDVLVIDTGLGFERGGEGGFGEVRAFCVFSRAAGRDEVFRIWAAGG